MLVRTSNMVRTLEQITTIGHLYIWFGYTNHPIQSIKLNTNHITLVSKFTEHKPIHIGRSTLFQFWSLLGFSLAFKQPYMLSSCFVLALFVMQYYKMTSVCIVTYIWVLSLKHIETTGEVLMQFI